MTGRARPAPGLIIAAPASGSGKTVVAAGLIRALIRQGLAVAPAKIGPDYIDPAFLAAAAGRDCASLDPWALRPASLAARVAVLGDSDLVLCEGVMGLFDGALDAAGETRGSTADLAALTGWPVILVVDASRQGASAAALVRGFRDHRADVPVAGVLFNRVGGEAHRAAIETACARHLPGLPILGWLPRDPALSLPSRHLGLVQARELEALAIRLDAIADLVARHVDLAALRHFARPARLAPVETSPPIPPPGARIAVARDDAFAFAYAETLAGWRKAGAELRFFSPLADEAPWAEADSVYLPGGYPELHAERLAGARIFLGGLRARAQAGAVILGECGGAMVLGETLEDAQGAAHAMAGLLPLATSFRARRLQLGYRDCALLADCPLGPVGTRFRAHEFHYATVLREGPAERLFAVRDSRGNDLGPRGLMRGRVLGSFLHLIDRAG